MLRWTRVPTCVLVIVLAASVVGGCVRNTAPVAPDAPPPPPDTEGTTAARRPTPPPPEPPPPPPSPPTINPDDEFAARDLEELNRESPLQPVFFGYDSAEVDAEGRRVLDANAVVLQRYPTWEITVEGHCDERGTAEYNLALGERRALSARDYLVARGLEADRIRTVSYGKEFPFDPESNEQAWARNRRAHFVITAK